MKLPEPLSIPEIASQIDMALVISRELSGKSWGAAPPVADAQKRIARAKELLRSPDTTIAEIALICGFVDQSHLTRAFPGAKNSHPLP